VLRALVAQFVLPGEGERITTPKAAWRFATSGVSLMPVAAKDNMGCFDLHYATASVIERIEASEIPMERLVPGT
jgi:hypothetical protein